LSTHTYPLMLYLHGFLEKDPSLLDTCLSFLPGNVFSESTSGASCPLEKQRGGRYQRPGGRWRKPTVKDGMQSQVLASVSTKNSVLAHAAAAAAGSATMNNIQNQWDRKRNLIKEYVEELGGSRLRRAAAKA
jgi:hypothetical protein